MWIVSQIGAREHYAIPRALHRSGRLALLCTDAWIRPGSPWTRLPGTSRLKDRWHEALGDAEVFAPNARMLAFEVEQRLKRHRGWDAIIARNTLYQELTTRHLSRLSDTPGTKNEAQRTENSPAPPTLFSYSCAALELFRFAKARGWSTVLGQMDPGPEEERLVGEEHRRQTRLASSWKPTPPIYWESWRKEVELADRILVNSEWSRQCLLKEGVPDEKMEIVPLVYEGGEARSAAVSGRLGLRSSESEGWLGSERLPGNKERRTKNEEQRTLSVLFLGMINVRKGVGRLLEAMRLLRDEPILLTLAGPTEIDPSAWSDLPKVRWVGPLPRSEVGRHYEAADLFILPTISDGYALTQLEALSRGIPVMASRFCGDAVTDGVNGWILDDLEPETIANSIRAAQKALPLETVKMPPFSLDDLGERLLGARD